MKRGFTLIETIISIGLITMLIIAVSSVNMMSVKMNASTRGRDSAFNIARGICEVFRSEDEIYEEYNVRVYKYIDDINEISNIKYLFENRDGNASDDSTAIGGNTKRYTVFIELEKSIINGGELSSSPRFKKLKVKVVERGREKSPVTLVYAR